MMRTILRKRFRKRIAILLLAVMLIPLIPIVPLSAAGGSPFPFDYPSTDSFYPADFVIRLFNCGEAYYLRVRTDNGLKIAYWRYLEQYTIAVTPDPFSKYTFYDDVGNVVSNPFSSTNDNNLLLFRSIDEDLTGDTPFGIVQASNVNLYAYDYGVSLAESDQYIYFYRNYMSVAVTPTPTPEPQPEIKDWFDYPDLPSNFSSDTKCILRTHSDGVNDGQLIGIASNMGSAAFNYPNFYKSRTPYNYNSQASITNAITINTWLRSQYYFSVFTVNYDEENDVYSVGSNLKSGWSSPGEDSWFTSVVFDWNGETICSWSLVPNNDLIVTGLQAGTYANSPQNWFEILFTNHNYVPGTSDTPNLSPTPNPSPTLMPQPSITPEPTVEPPDTGDDNNWTGLFGWFKKLINAILSIPMKIVNGLLSGLKYIFIPDMGKVKSLFSTLNDKFGIQKPLLFEFDPILLKNPENVVMHFKPISLNGEPTETVDITVIDFDKVDDWLETEQGQIIIRIIQAVFMLTMWGYMIYIFRKHVASINYTDSDTLEHSKYWH